MLVLLATFRVNRQLCAQKWQLVIPANVTGKLKRHSLNMKLTEKQIEEIADNLDCGMRCFYNLKSGEIKTVLNFDTWIGADEEQWEDELKEIEDNWSDYFEFVGFESHESFQIMADFANSIEDKGIQNKLMYALNRPKPFQNFKWQIDNSGEVRQQWFDYKNMRYIEWIKEQIDLHSKDFE